MITPEMLENVNVLFADDDRDTLNLLKFIAGLHGWNAVDVECVEEVLNAVNDGPRFDAIVMDINYAGQFGVPMLTGITAAREIRKIRPNVPIVFITAYSNSIIREEIRRVNAELIPKPFNQDELFNRLTRLIYWHRAAMLNTYDGPERRTSSINRTQHRRRAADQIIQPSEILIDIIDEARSKYDTKGQS